MPIIRIADKVAKQLNELRHEGQSYNGVIQELLNFYCERTNSDAPKIQIPRGAQGKNFNKR